MELWYTLANITLNDLLDILLVGTVFFALTFFFRGTQAIALVRGLALLFGAAVLVSSLFDLVAVRWLLERGLTVLIIAVPVIFQPELRRVLERLGRAGFLMVRSAPDSVRTRIIDDVCLAAERLSERRHGALIVLERSSSLQEYIRTGIPLNSAVSPQLLLTIFWPKTELHDGAAIIDRSGKLAAAAAVLPLSSARNLQQPKLGTRHRAALGMTEVSDAICIIVSEESGRISIANGGRLIARLDSKRLKTILNAFYGPERTQGQTLPQRLREQLSDVLIRMREREKNT
ncbi:MAG: diadenylate cyclase CdaA [bacterium]|nr:diadenylate cyclase CdaA [bacterium]